MRASDYTRAKALVIPLAKRDIVFGFSVRLSVLDAFVSFCAPNSSYSFHHTQTKHILNESWVGVWHGSPFFRTLQNFDVVGL